MADPSKFNSNTGLAFVLGILVVVAGLGAYALFAGDGDLALSVEGEDTAIEKAAEALSDG
jgi:hypothetical protein